MLRPQGSAGQIHLNYNEQMGLEGIVAGVAARYLFVKRIVLYGSKARGDFGGESDIDLLFVCDGPVPRAVKFEVSDMIYEHELANDIVVSVVFVPQSEFDAATGLFISKIKREGVVIWSRE